LITDYYLQLAIVQRAQGDAEGEVRTLERYLRVGKDLWGTVGAEDKMQVRLVNLRKKIASAGTRDATSV
jgi:hypothetical protein